jgi:hypothetical protein
MYYSIILITVMPATVKEKVKRNLWFALSVWGFYYNLRDLSIQAIVPALRQASEIVRPSFFRILVTNAWGL